MLSRIDRLFSNINDDAVVFINSYANIFYYSGFTSEDAFLLITRDYRYIITDSRYFVQARIEAPDYELIDIKKGWKYIFEFVKGYKVYFEENALTYGMYTKISGYTDSEFLAAQTQIDLPRQVKDSEEIQRIAEAEAIGDKAFLHILDILHAGMTEHEIALELETSMKHLGAKALSFDTIVASGVRSSMPHGTASDKVIEKGDLVTLDFGCKYNGYCSDMTRTVVIGTHDSQQKEIYDVVLDAQQTAIDMLKPNVLCSEVDKTARRVIEEAGYGLNFSHSLGHSVGIEIHENPVFSPKSADILKDGNVLSVEPGIYIDGWGGVRIEDLIAVDNGKITNLTGSPKELIVI